MNPNEENNSSDGCFSITKSNSCKTKEGTGKSFSQIRKLFEQFGTFQIRAILLLCPTMFCQSTFTLAPVFLVVTPPFACKPLSGLENQTGRWTQNNTNNFTSTHKENEMNACNKIAFLTYNNKSRLTSPNRTQSTKEECLDGWVYNLTKGNTVASEFDLVCQSSWKRPLVFSSIMTGGAIGSLVGGYISDRYGRKFVITVSFLTSLIITGICPFSPSYWIYIFLLLCNGFNRVLLYFALFVLALEFVHSGRRRNLAALSLNASTYLGVLTTPLIAYVSFNWKWMHWITAVFSASSLLPLWFVPKSPKWLLQRNPKEALQMLRKIARTNKIVIDEKSLTLERLKSYKEGVEREASNNQKEDAITTSTLWRNKALRKRLIIICILWNLAYLGYYTFALSSSNVGGDIYINAFVGGFADLTAAFFLWLLLRKCGRRFSFALMTGLSGIFALISQPILKVNVPFGIALVMIGRLFACTALSLIIVYTGELFPTLLRSTSVGIASMTSRVGTILSPFLVLLGEEVDLSYSFYIIGTLCLFGALLTFLLPETGNASLPNTMNEALELDKRKRRYSMKGVLNNNFSTKDENANNGKA